MAKYMVRRYEQWAWNDETQVHDLGPAIEVVQRFEADYPAKAFEAVSPLVESTCSERTTIYQRGKRVSAPTYPKVDGAVYGVAWVTARGLCVLENDADESPTA